MKDLKNVLVVINHRDDGEIVFEKALALAAGSGATLHVTKVIWEGFVDLSVHDIEQSQALKTFVMASEETFLEDLIDSFNLSGARPESSVLWNKHEHEAILHAADECKADLIIKPTRHPSDTVVRTPQDWHLLRHSKVPVLLVKPGAWMEKPGLVAAIDVQNESQHELSARIISTANDIRQFLGGNLTLVNAFPTVEHWVGPITVAIDFGKVRDSVQSEIEHLLSKAAAGLDIQPDGLMAREGEVHKAIEALVTETSAEILVIGTAQRTGAAGTMIGNTSEAILHHANCDVLVLR